MGKGGYFLGQTEGMGDEGREKRPLRGKLATYEVDPSKDSKDLSNDFGMIDTEDFCKQLERHERVKNNKSKKGVSASGPTTGAACDVTTENL